MKQGPPPEDEPLPEESLPPEDEGFMPEDAWQPPDAGAPATGREAMEAAPGVEAIPEILDRLGNVEEVAEYVYAELTNYPAGGPWYWKELNPAQRHELWVELDAFVTWLQNRILCHWSNSEGWIAPCWYQHPDAVELLTALMVAHKGAYLAKSKKPGFELSEWFTRALWPTLEAFTRRATFKACVGESEHRPSSGGRVLMGSSAAFLAFVADETAAPAPATDDEGRSGA